MQAESDRDLVFPLIQLDEGEEGIVEQIVGGHRLLSRLASLGIKEGVRLKVLRNTQGLLMVLAKDTRIALGMGEGRKVLVKRIARHEEKEKKRQILVALSGQPNVGKSTVFNVLTGLSQHVGNWPGKTVEKKEGTHVTENYVMTVVDLPGTYALSSFSEEERIARDFILKEKPDVIALIVNAQALERSLYLLTELLLLGPPVILAVNMMDVAEEQGINIDIDALRKSLGIPVVPMVATKNRGIKELVREIENVIEGKVNYEPKLPQVAQNHKDMFLELVRLLNGHISDLYPLEWCAFKLMEGDREVIEEVERVIPRDVWERIRNLLSEHEDSLRAVVGGRYDWIEEVTKTAIRRFRRGQVLLTDRIDHVLTNPIFGIPLLLLVLGFVFLLTYGIGLPAQGLLENAFLRIGEKVAYYFSSYSPWLRGLIIDGIIGGAGTVISFVPILGIFFLALSILEDTGYIARVAFVMDRFMHIMGLHGKSFLPLCLGFGCNVPGILASRIVESKMARILTVILSPFVPCVGRLGVLTFLSGAFFFEKAAIVTWLLVLVNILTLMLVGFIMSKFLKLENVPFIMELPLYHKPRIKNVLSELWPRIFSFLKRAGTVILIFSVLLYILFNPPSPDTKETMLRYAEKLDTFGKPFGLDWKLLVALVSSVVAKENSIATLGVLYGHEGEGLREALRNEVKPASLISFLVILMLFIPCLPAGVALTAELGRLKWFLIQVILMLLLSLGAGFVAYRIATLLGL